MTKGKYAAKAAARKAQIEAEGNLSHYQERVRKLTAENKALKARMVEKDKAHSRAVRILKAERNEGTSPTLRVIEEECKRLREDLDRSERERKKTQATWDRAFQRLREHFRQAHGQTRLEATESMVNLLDPNGDGGEFTLLWNDEKKHVRSRRTEESEEVAGAHGTVEFGDALMSDLQRVRALQRARGERR